MHDKTRRVLNRVLSASVMTRLRDRFVKEADALIDELVERGSFDAIADLAEALPADGVSRRHGHAAREPPLPVALRQHGLAWLQQQMQRDAFAADGFGAAIHAASDTGELTEEEAPIVARSLLTAGVDTTVSGIGAAVHCLARFPKEFARLRADPSLARAAFEEAVRYETPVQTFFRTTMRPVELGGTAVDEGEKVLMFLGAANRDPRHWECPDDYDITRRTVGHVGFGSGIHQCVGQLFGAARRRMRALRTRPQGRFDRDHRPDPPPLQQHIARIVQPAGDCATGAGCPLMR